MRLRYMRMKSGIQLMDVVTSTFHTKLQLLRKSLSEITTMLPCKSRACVCDTITHTMYSATNY